ncbi:hypothetical protein ACVWYG_003737 [Pedobacter sp. UYEF25]
MFKKIHSNRNSNDTVFTELKKEFSPYVYLFGKKVNNILTRYPKSIFGIMVGLILASFILSLTIFNVDGKIEPPKKVLVNATHTTPPKFNISADDGLNSIIETTGNLKETIKLKQQINSIIAKKELTKQDSIVLQRDLNQLQEMNRQINPNK